ncbi:MAG: GNAT family N-acetyltransferase [Nitrososphaeria archaeon]
MIRECGPRDRDKIFQVINEAARAYEGVIPEDCYHRPYMSMEELQQEMNTITSYGHWKDNQLVGVMGIQPFSDVTLIRHSYVLPEHQRKGIGSALLNHLLCMTLTTRVLVGTWRDAQWAIRFYQKHGFKLLSHGDKLLRKYWNITERQIQTSVVLGRTLKKS